MLPFLFTYTWFSLTTYYTGSEQRETKTFVKVSVKVSPIFIFSAKANSYI